jgi:membrane protein required for colicin V production
MSFTWPDIALAAVMLISGLMAIMRGLSREVLSLLAWGLAAVAAFYAISSAQVREQASSLLQPYVGDNDIVVTIVVAAVAFLVVLIVLSIIGAKISDALLETGAGPDRPHAWLFLWNAAWPRPDDDGVHLLCVACPARQD